MYDRILCIILLNNELFLLIDKKNNDSFCITFLLSLDLKNGSVRLMQVKVSIIIS